MGNKKILLGLTTTPGSDWRKKVSEIDKLGLKELALFPTCLNEQERKELYGLLEKTKLKRIPHVHLRSDMACDELEYLINKYGTKVFNTHPEKFFPFKHDLSKYYDSIFVENAGPIPSEEELQKLAGICVDFSHLKSFLKTKINPEYDKFLKYMDRYKIGCCHISAIYKEVYTDYGDPCFPERPAYDSHDLQSMDELDYIAEYKNYLPEYCSLELTNSFSQQLEAKTYLEKLLNL